METLKTKTTLSASELRIGNWLHEKWEKETVLGGEVYALSEDAYVKVESISYDHLLKDMLPDSYSVNNSDLSFFQPIPLSPDILIKNCGFIENEMYDGETWVVYESKSLTFEIAFYNDIVEMQKSYVDKLKSIRCYVTANEKYKRHEFIEVDIVSIHHVQNLIFALTGEELTINL